MRHFFVAAIFAFAFGAPCVLGAQQASVTASVTILPAVSAELTPDERSIADLLDLDSHLLRDAAPGRAAAIVTRELIDHPSIDDPTNGAPTPWIRYVIAVDS
jgi:hypothetical protein